MDDGVCGWLGCSLNESAEHDSKTATIARITPPVMLATLKQSFLAHQMLSDLMRKNKREQDFTKEC